MGSFVAERSIPSCMKLINSSKDFIKEYALQWKNYSFYYYSMKRMFEYLDRFYLKNLGNHAKSLTDTALDLWQSKIFMAKITELQQAVNEEIRKDRMDEVVDLDIIRLGI